MIPPCVVFRRECEGKIWSTKDGVSRRPRSHSGVMASFENKSSEKKKGVVRRFSALAMETKLAAAVDEKGMLLVVNLAANVYRVVSFEVTASLAFGQESVLVAAVPRTSTTSALVFDVLGKRRETTKTGHKGPIFHLESCDDKLLSLSRDTAKIWSFIEGEKKYTRTSFFSTRNDKGNIVSGHFGGATKVSLLFADSICIYSITGDCLAQFRESLRTIAFDGQKLIGARGAQYYEWKEDDLIVRKFPAGISGIDWIDFSNNDVLFLSDEGRVVGATSDKFFEVGTSAPITQMAVNGFHLLLATSAGRLTFVDLRVARTKHELHEATKHELHEALQKEEVEESDDEEPPLRGIKAVNEKKEVFLKPVEHKSSQVRLERIERVSAKNNTFLTPKRLKFLLVDQGTFPAKHRPLIWRMLLKLPESDEAFEALLDGETNEEPSVASAEVASSKLMSQAEKRSLVRVVKALVSWCRVLGNVEWLPNAAYPFVAVFQRDATCAFEAMALTFGKIAVGYFSCWPEAPLQLLVCVQELTSYFAEDLLKEVSPREWAWPMMKSFFSEILPAETWLAVFDFIFMAASESMERATSLVLLVPVAYVLSQANVLKGLTKSEILDWSRRPSAQPPASFLQSWKRLAAVCESNAILKKSARGSPPSRFEGLGAVADDARDKARQFPFPLFSKNDDIITQTYPAFMAFPTVATDIARKERERVALELQRFKENNYGDDSSTIMETQKAEKAARQLAATEKAAAAAEEASLKRLADLSHQRFLIENEYRSSALSRRLEVATRAEKNARLAMEATTKRREIAKQRAEDEVVAAEKNLKAVAEDATKREKVAMLEAKAIERVARLRDGVEREAEFKNFQEEAASKARRLELESRLESGRVAFEARQRLEDAKARDAAEAQEDAAMQSEFQRLGVARSLLEASLRKEVERAEAESKLLESRADDERLRAARRRLKTLNRQMAAQTNDALSNAKEPAERSCLENRQAQLDTLSQRALLERSNEDRQALAFDRNQHHRQVAAMRRAADADEKQVYENSEAALKAAAAEFDKENAARRQNILSEDKAEAKTEEETRLDALRRDVKVAADLKERARADRGETQSAFLAKSIAEFKTDARLPTSHLEEDLSPRGSNAAPNFTSLATTLNDIDDDAPNKNRPSSSDDDDYPVLLTATEDKRTTPPSASTPPPRDGGGLNLDDLDALLSRARAVLDDAVFNDD